MGIKLVCPRCGRGNDKDPLGDWVYTGASTWYASCPRCKTSVNIHKNRKKTN